MSLPACQASSFMSCKKPLVSMNINWTELDLMVGYHVDGNLLHSQTGLCSFFFLRKKSNSSGCLKSRSPSSRSVGVRFLSTRYLAICNWIWSNCKFKCINVLCLPTLIFFGDLRLGLLIRSVLVFEVSYTMWSSITYCFLLGFVWAILCYLLLLASIRVSCKAI